MSDIGYRELAVEVRVHRYQPSTSRWAAATGKATTSLNVGSVGQTEG